ncbi:MAG TPA: hypothetical protein VGD62_03385, partial [Acidobacteriaceae bacterium]
AVAVPADEGKEAQLNMRKVHSPTGAKPQCPQCEAIELRRNGRVGFLQRKVYPRFGYFPWECGQCRQIFMLKQRSTGYRQHAINPPKQPKLELFPSDNRS